MKRIFLSLPMKNRSDEAIKNTIEGMKRIIRAYYPNEELEFVDNFDAGYEISQKMVEDSKHPSCLYLSRAIFKMAQCDQIAIIRSDILWRTNDEYHGCWVEEQIADRYFNSEPIVLPDPDGNILLPDLIQKAKEYIEQQKKSCSCIPV